jgi:hypothetical protein
VSPDVVGLHRAAEDELAAPGKPLVEWTPEQQDELRAHYVRRGEEAEVAKGRRLEDALRGTRVDPFLDDESIPTT